MKPFKTFWRKNEPDIVFARNHNTEHGDMQLNRHAQYFIRLYTKQSGLGSNRAEGRTKEQTRTSQLDKRSSTTVAMNFKITI